jgi:hypothetical protein
MEDGKKEGGRSMEGGKGGTFLWSLGSMGAPWELSSGAWGLLGGPWGFFGRGWELSSGAWELLGGPWEFQGCSLGTPGGCLGALGLSQGDDGKRLVACGERLKLASSPQGESREGSGEGVGTVGRVVCQFLGDLFDHICLFFLVLFLLNWT